MVRNVYQSQNSTCHVIIWLEDLTQKNFTLSFGSVRSCSEHLRELCARLMFPPVGTPLVASVLGG